MMVIEQGMGKTQTIVWVIVFGFLGILMFITLSQPVWNAKNMIQQHTDECKQVGGVQIIHHGLFGDTYKCEPRLDRGVKL